MASSLIALLMPVLVGLVLLLLIGFMLARLYRRATREVSLVRTGAGGRKVVIDGGCLLIPVLHDLTMVNMRTLQIPVRRDGASAMITKDRLRVDSTTEFFVRVAGDADAISTAAQTLGNRTFNPEQLREMIEGKLVDGLRAVAAQMTMDELHAKRGDFVQQVKTIVAEDLQKNGLELESVSLTALDQTSFEGLDENNAFNAEGMRVLAEAVAAARVQKAQAEATARVKVAQTEQEAELREMDIRRAQEEARVQNAIKVAEIQANEKSAVAQRDEEVARAREEARIARERALEEAEIDRRRAVELREQEKAIAVAQASEAESKAKAAANVALAEAIKSQEGVQTARAIEEAERRKRIAILEAEEKAERNATETRVAAAAERQAADDRAAAALTLAEAEARSIEIRAAAARTEALARAEGQRELVAAENGTAAEILAHREKLASLQALPALMEAAMAPVEKIGSIHLHQVNGLGSSGTGGSGSMATDLQNLIAAQAVHLPILQKIASQAGLTLDNGAEGVLATATGVALGQAVDAAPKA